MVRPKNWYADRRGFSLIEALMAIAIFAFGVLAVVTMLDVAFSSGRLSKSMTTATELGAMMLDRIRAETISTTDPYAKRSAAFLAFNGLDTNGTAPVAEPAATVFREWQPLVQQNLPEGRGTVTVTNDDPALPLHYRVTVEITFRGILFRPVTLETIMLGEM